MSDLDFLYLNRGQVVQDGKESVKAFGRIFSGLAVNIEKVSRQLSETIVALEQVHNDDGILLENTAATLVAFPELQDAFNNEFKLMLTASTETIGTFVETRRRMTRTFHDAFKRFENSEMDPLWQDQLWQGSASPVSRPEKLSEATQEERLLREFFTQAAAYCESTIVLLQARSGLALLEAMQAADPQRIRDCGANYILLLAGLQELLVFEPTIRLLSGHGL